MPNSEKPMDGNDEIEVTPEMVSAGIDAMHCEYQPAFESAGEGVVKIFRAMMAASNPAPAKPTFLR